MSAYLYYAPSGVEGDITRPDESDVEPIMLGSPAAQKFGVPIKIVSGKAVIFNGGAETAASFAGVLVREVPGISGSLNQGLTDNIPYAAVPQGLCVRGYINVKCPVGTPARFGSVYVRIIAASGKAVGDFEATSDGSNSVLLTNASWASDGKDSDNNAELRLNIAR